MFGHNNILPFIFAVLPALIYGYTIFKHSPTNSIHLNKLWIYTIIGFLSITFINFFTFIFPDFQKPLFQEFIGSATVDGELIFFFKKTSLTFLFFAFFQIAMLEEFSKWISFKCGDLFRGRNSLRDHPYAIMFYTTMVAAGFAALENTQYAAKTINGGFGENLSVFEVLFVRTFSSVVMHMICGAIMGYYIALGAKSEKMYRIRYNLIGVFSAAVLHGFYDFTILDSNMSSLTFSLGDLSFHWPSTIIVMAGLVITYFMATDLKYRKIKRRIFKKKY
jgi:RsiW-degrading membrane proteinase PrsW (M82 family)